MPTLAETLRKAGVKDRPRAVEPLWAGPESDSEENGGITYSLLSRFLSCRERFRLLVVKGLRSQEGFNHRIEYGNMWHVCEEAHAEGTAQHGGWLIKLAEYCKLLCRSFPTQQEQIDHWYNVCKVQFPVYIEYWAKHKDVTNRSPLLQEYKFKVPYTLPSGRIVYLRGKWDSVDQVEERLLDENRMRRHVCLQENKSKGDIQEVLIRRQLSRDLQTMLYLVALRQLQDTDEWLEVTRKGPRGYATRIYASQVRYNAIRRPLSGGKGTIVRHKPTKKNPAGESKEAFYKRLEEYIRSEPENYFMRWNVDITKSDIDDFRRKCLEPILEALCDWYTWVTTPSGNKDPFAKGALYGHLSYGMAGGGIHWVHPFGVYNPLDEGGSSDLDNYLATGSTVGLVRTDKLFPELT